MAGTVTGRDANVWLVAHDAGTAPSSFQAHSVFAISDFSLTLGRGTVEQVLVGQPGSYYDQGKLTIEGSLTAAKFGISGVSDMLSNLVDTGRGVATTELLAISGCISDATDATYLSWYLPSCQVTGYEVSIGDADTVTEAAIDFTYLLPQNVRMHAGGNCIMDGA